MIGIETGAFGVVALLILVVAALVVLLYLIPVGLWVAAFASGAYVGLFTLVGMRLRKVDILHHRAQTASAAVKAGLDIPTNALEAHYPAGGRVTGVVGALIAADTATIPWTTGGRGDRPGRA